MKGKLIDLCERGVVPDGMTRMGIRHLIGRRLDQEQKRNGRDDFFDYISKGPIAEDIDDANNQHYEVPDDFFRQVLGPRLKYSSCLYESGNETLAMAEDAMLALTCQRAELADGQDVLELGCGWGSLTLYMAEQFPNAKITAVSNSNSQRCHIMRRADLRGLKNVNVITANVGTLSMDRQFDRIVSVEMFEHMRNYAALTTNVRQWLRNDGRAFIHIFCHRNLPYLFEVEGETDWMAENFFTGGIMPSFDIFEQSAPALSVERKWWINGTHYERTLEDWCDLLDARRKVVTDLFMTHYGESKKDAQRRIQRWRIFLMSSAELFGYADGTEWGVGHFMLRPNS